MTIVRVGLPIAEAMLFGFSEHPVIITGAGVDYDRQEIVFEVEGEDLPEAGEATAWLSRRTNRAGEVFHTMKFEARR